MSLTDAHVDGRHADLAYWADKCPECAALVRLPTCKPQPLADWPESDRAWALSSGFVQEATR